MRSLVDDMTAADPLKGPTMDEVVSRFDKTVKSLSSWKLRSRAGFRKGIDNWDPSLTVPHWLRRMEYIITRVPAVPSIKAE